MRRRFSSSIFAATSIFAAGSLRFAFRARVASARAARRRRMDSWMASFLRASSARSLASFSAAFLSFSAWRMSSVSFFFFAWRSALTS